MFDQCNLTVGNAVLLPRKTKRDKSWQHLRLPKRSPTTVLTRPWADKLQRSEESWCFQIHWALPAGVRIPSLWDVWLQRCVVWERERRKGSGAIASSHCLVFFLGLCHGACSVAATYKPPMLVPRVRLPAGAYALQQYEKECV